MKIPRIALALGAVLAVMAAPSGAQPLPTQPAAHDCAGCRALDAVLDAFRALVRAIEQGIAEREQRGAQLTDKAINNPPLTNAERDEARRLDQELRKLHDAKDAWERTIQDLETAKRDCAGQCMAPPQGAAATAGGPRTAGDILADPAALEQVRTAARATSQRGDFWEEFAQTYGAARCPKCQPIRDAMYRAFYLRYQAREDIKLYDRWLTQIDALLAGQSPPPAGPGSERFRSMAPWELREERLTTAAMIAVLAEKIAQYDHEIAEGARAFAECNRTCGGDAAPPTGSGLVPVQPQEPPKPIGTTPPGAAPAAAPGAQPPSTGFMLPEVPAPYCLACRPAAEQAERLRKLASVNLLALLLVRPPVAWPYEQLEERIRALDRAIGRVRACNLACVAVLANPLLYAVINQSGVNPFDPDAPIGVKGPPTPLPPDQPGTVQFSSATYSGTEGQPVTVVVTRAGGRRGAASVEYIASTRTATEGADFVPVRGSFSWADGDATPRTFAVQLVDDNVLEDTELVELTLLRPTGAGFGEPNRATILIADNDAPLQTGSLQFSQPTYATAEGQGQVTLTVTRTAGASGAASVRYITVSGTASGADFGGTSGTLSWADGDSAPRSFSIAITDDNQVEGTETFSVQLSAATGAALGAPASATVSIADNDTASNACGPWQPGTYVCSGTCDPCPSPQRLAIDGQRITVSPFHGGGAATFTGCSPSVTSDSSTLVYFGQANHRATLINNGAGYRADIRSSGGGSCAMSCTRTGP